MKLAILIIIGFTIIALLFLDHFRIHGYFYDPMDFTNALTYLLTSHEGLIVLTVLILIGVLMAGCVV